MLVDRVADCPDSSFSACAAGRQDDEAIELAFSKKKIEERKAWLAGFEPGTYLDQSVSKISYSDFVNKAWARLVFLSPHLPSTGVQAFMLIILLPSSHSGFPTPLHG